MCCYSAGISDTSDRRRGGRKYQYLPPDTHSHTLTLVPNPRTQDIWFGSLYIQLGCYTHPLPHTHSWLARASSTYRAPGAHILVMPRGFRRAALLRDGNTRILTRLIRIPRSYTSPTTLLPYQRRHAVQLRAFARRAFCYAATACPYRYLPCYHAACHLLLPVCCRIRAHTYLGSYLPATQPHTFLLVSLPHTHGLPFMPCAIPTLPHYTLRRLLCLPLPFTCPRDTAVLAALHAWRLAATQRHGLSNGGSNGSRRDARRGAAWTALPHHTYRRAHCRTPRTATLRHFTCYACRTLPLPTPTTTVPAYHLHATAATGSFTCLPAISWR